MSIEQNTISLQEILEALKTKASGSGGAVLPTLTNEAAASDLLEGKELIDSKGNKIVGTFSLDAEMAAQAELIESIKSGFEGKTGSNGASAVSLKDVNFYDYDGTILHSYTVEEAQALIELPVLPTHEGLICQGWNYSLDTIKSYNRAVDVGAMYITDDGKTRLYIRIAAEGRMTVPLYFSQTVANGVAIDWGDGSATQTLSGTGDVNTTHSYLNIGDYVITLDVMSGCILELGCNSFSYCVMGKTNNTRIYCNMLQKVEIGNSVTSINSHAFAYCASLTSVTISDSITSISDYAFQYCISLTNVTIGDSVTSIGSHAFEGCTRLTSVTIPDSVTSISAYAFRNCSSLMGVIIPDSLTSSIGDSTFMSCSHLTSATIGNSVTVIGRQAFYNCNNLTSIIIGSSVTNIAEMAFQSNYGMVVYDFSSHSSVPTLTDKSAFMNIPSDCVIKVPVPLYTEWIAATNWSTYASQIVAV